MAKVIMQEEINSNLHPQKALLPTQLTNLDHLIWLKDYQALENLIQVITKVVIKGVIPSQPQKTDKIEPPVYSKIITLDLKI